MMRVEVAGGAPCRARRTTTGGFTLVEVAVVLAILGVLMGLGLSMLDRMRERDALSHAPKQLLSALENARSLAVASGRDVVLVLVGNGGAEVAAECRTWLGGGVPQDCVRYWLLEDLVAPGSGRFDDAALAAFDPDAPAALGDRLLDADVLPDGVFIGRHPGFVPPPVDARSTLFAGLPLGAACSFCSGSPPRGYVRFGPDGTAQLGGSDPAAPPPVGGSLFLSVARSDGVLPDTRMVVILQPAGLVTDRLGATLR